MMATINKPQYLLYTRFRRVAGTSPQRDEFHDRGFAASTISNQDHKDTVGEDGLLLS